MSKDYGTDSPVLVTERQLQVVASYQGILNDRGAVRGRNGESATNDLRRERFCYAEESRIVSFRTSLTFRSLLPQELIPQGNGSPPAKERLKVL